MAATFIYGVDGAIYVGGKLVSYMSGWTMNINTGAVDTPDMGSSGPVRTYSKYRDFTGTLNGMYRFDPASSSQTAQENITHQFVSGGTPAAVVAKFIESSQSMYVGAVVFTNLSKGQSAEGLQTWSGDWAQSNGPLTFSTDTSS